MAESRSDKKSQPSLTEHAQREEAKPASLAYAPEKLDKKEENNIPWFTLENAIELARDFQQLVSEFAELPQSLDMEALDTHLSETVEKLGQDKTAQSLLMDFRKINNDTSELIRKRTWDAVQKIKKQMEGSLSQEMVHSLFEEIEDAHKILTRAREYQLALNNPTTHDHLNRLNNFRDMINKNFELLKKSHPKEYETFLVSPTSIIEAKGTLNTRIISPKIKKLESQLADAAPISSTFSGISRYLNASKMYRFSPLSTKTPDLKELSDHQEIYEEARKATLERSCTFFEWTIKAFDGLLRADGDIIPGREAKFRKKWEEFAPALDNRRHEIIAIIYDSFHKRGKNYYNLLHKILTIEMAFLNTELHSLLDKAKTEKYFLSWLQRVETHRSMIADALPYLYGFSGFFDELNTTLKRIQSLVPVVSKLYGIDPNDHKSWQKKLTFYKNEKMTSDGDNPVSEIKSNTNKGP